jgi:citrate lyase subunit beta / citryl-CoA lyase
VKLPVTYLFVPGNRPERFDKALAAGADAIILDLEDAVSPGDKDLARDYAGQWIAAHPDALPRTVVRINDGATQWFGADLVMLQASGVRYAMLPKAETPEQIAAVRAMLPAGGLVLPIIETARGVQNLEAVAAAPGVQRLAFGTLDYAVDLDLSGDERGLIVPATRIALVSRCAGLAAPISGVTPAIDDEERLLADLAFGRAFGFGAKLCIHPKQVAAIARALEPTAAEIEWATRVLAASQSSEGAVQLEGKMVDRPVVLKAESILERAANCRNAAFH